jgi:hypothetical protein
MRCASDATAVQMPPGCDAQELQAVKMELGFIYFADFNHLRVCQLELFSNPFSLPRLADRTTDDNSNTAPFLLSSCNEHKINSNWGSSSLFVFPPWRIRWHKIHVIELLLLAVQWRTRAL